MVATAQGQAAMQVKCVEAMAAESDLAIATEKARIAVAALAASQASLSECWDAWRKACAQVCLRVRVVVHLMFAQLCLTGIVGRRPTAVVVVLLLSFAMTLANKRVCPVNLAEKDLSLAPATGRRGRPRQKKSASYKPALADKADMAEAYVRLRAMQDAATEANASSADEADLAEAYVLRRARQRDGRVPGQALLSHCSR